MLELGECKVLVEAHGASLATAATPGLVQSSRPFEPTFDPPRIASSVSQPETPLPANDQPAPTAVTGDVAKAPRATPSLRSATGALGAKDPCNPPYTLDPQGRKKFRHECFTERAIR